MFKPIPQFIYKRSNQITMIIFVPIFALLFISIYTPFDFDKIDPQGKTLAWLNIPSRELAVQLITLGLILVGMAVATVSRWMMGLYTRHREISYIHYILWIACEILIMSLIFTIVSSFTDTDKSVMVLIPYTMCYIFFIWQERVAQLRTLTQRLAEDETLLQAAYIQIYDDKGDMRLSIRRENLLFVESADNYVCVWYVNNNQPKKVMVRNTLKHIAEHLESTHIRRCHRSYVVNLDLVKVLRREKEGIFVELGIDGVPDIPISKTYIENVQNLLMSGPDVA